jgi:hypothetical protein
LDLSAFRGGDADGGVDVPPPPPPPRRPEPVPDATSARATGGGRRRGSAGRQGKKVKPEAAQPRSRVTTNVPAVLARRARERAEQEELYLTDVALDAYARHHEAVRKRHSTTSRAPDAGLPPRPRRRRRRVVDPTYFVLYLSPQELELLDGLAQECGISRSELVSTLLEVELGDDAPVGGKRTRNVG